jgi:hypothetical protein
MILSSLADYVGNLLAYDQSLIVLGRSNLNRIDLNESYIIVDSIDQRVAGVSESFDSTLEVMTYITNISASCTLNFYGTNAHTNAIGFITLQPSQASYELLRDNNFNVYHTSSIRNIKSLDGSDYNNRYEIEINLIYNEKREVNTKRIDTLVTTTIRD